MMETNKNSRKIFRDLEVDLEIIQVSLIRVRKSLTEIFYGLEKLEQSLHDRTKETKLED